VRENPLLGKNVTDAMEMAFLTITPQTSFFLAKNFVVLKGEIAREAHFRPLNNRLLVTLFVLKMTLRFHYIYFLVDIKQAKFLSNIQE